MLHIDEPTDGGLILPGMARRHRGGTDSTIVNRLPILRYLPRHFRSHFVAMSGEFFGTFLFLFFAFSGTQVANAQTKPPTDNTVSQAANPAQLLYISLCFGFSLAVNAWAFFRISGGLFNPAVTLGLCLVGAVPYLRGSLVFISQLLGGIAAAGIVAVLFPGPLNVKTVLRPGTSITQGLFIEMLLTAELVFTIFMLAAEKHKATFIAPVGIGLSLFIAELSGVFYTGGSLNPARTFGPCVILHSFEHYHWIYWVGPMLGSLLASSLYKIMKMLEYETANPGQDFDEHEKENFDPEKPTIRPPPVVSIQPSQSSIDTMAKDSLARKGHVHESTDQERYDPDGTKAYPDSPSAGRGRHQMITGMKGSRKGAGFSPEREALEKPIGNSTEVYDAAPNAEGGHVQNSGAA